ncbi:MAG: lytic transglycosylase domain-containing protein, partial [Vicinamibacterales bacterium]
LSLRDGGEVVCPRAIVARIAPDEVPYPDPPVADAAAVVAEVPRPEQTAPEKSQPFAELISAVAAANEVDARLVHAIVDVESSYQPRARSPKGAKGLMQLMPATARQYSVRDPYDPRTNLEAGVRHLKDLLSRFDVTLAVAAYNAGEGVVRKYGGIPPFVETRAYVRQVLARIGPAH